MTPAVHTMMSRGMVSPVDSSTLPPTAAVTWVSRCTYAPRLARSFSTHSLVFSDTSGMILPMASTRGKCVSSKEICGYSFNSADANERSSAIDSKTEDRQGVGEGKGVEVGLGMG